MILNHWKLLLALVFGLSPLAAHAEQSALEGKIQRALGRLAPQVETLTEPNASLRGELEQLLEDGRGLYQLPLSTLTWKGESRSATRVLLELVDQYAQATSDPVLNARSRGYLKALKEKALFHPEKLQYEKLKEEVFPYLVGDAGLEVAALASKTLFEKATEEDTYDEEMLDQALTLLNSAFSLADGRTGTKEYFESTYLVLSALQDEKALQSLTSLLRAREAKDPARFAWVSEFFSKQENSLESLLKEAFLKKEEIDLALLSLDAPNSECEGVDVFESSHDQAILRALKSGDTSQKGVALSLLAKKSDEEIVEWFGLPEVEDLLRENPEVFLVDLKRSASILKIALQSERWQTRKEVVQALGAIEAVAKLLKRELIELLRDPEKKVLYAAAIVLGPLDGNVDALFVLYDALRDKENDDHFSAALALANFFGQEKTPAIPALIEGLSSLSAEKRRKAVFGIARIGVKAFEAVPRLIAMLEDPDQKVRFACVFALGSMSEVASSAVPGLVKLLGGSDLTIRRAVADTLGKIGQASAPAIPLLVEGLKDQDTDLRVNSAFALGSIGEKTPTVVNALIEALTDSVREVRRVAAVSLGKLKANSSIPALITALKDQEDLVREPAARALGEMEDQSELVVPALTQALHDRNIFVRSEAAIALGKIGKEAASSISELIKVFEGEESEFFRDSIISALGKIGQQAETVVPFLIGLVRRSELRSELIAIESLSQFGEKAVAVVPDILRILDKSSDYPMRLLEALEQIGDASPPTVSALIKLLGHRDHQVQRFVVHILKKLGSKSPVVTEEIVKALAEALVEEMNKPHSSALEMLSYSIAQFREKAVSALPALQKALDHSNVELRRVSALTIGDFGKDSKPAIPALLRALKDVDTRIASAAARSLGRIGENAEQVVPALLEAIEYAGTLEEATLALGAFEEKAAPALEQFQWLLSHPHSYFRQVAAIALARMGKAPPSVIPVIILTFRHFDENYRRNAVEALVKIGPASLIPLSYELRDPNPEVRKLAGEAIGRILKNQKNP